MNTRLKKKLIIGAVALIIFIIICSKISKKEKTVATGVNGEQNIVGEYVEILTDGSKLNVSEQLQKPKNLEGLEITNIQLKETNGITTLLADVENKTNQTVEEKMIAIDILNEKGEKITTVKGILNKVESQKKVQLNISVTADVSNAYDFRISNI